MKRIVVALALFATVALVAPDADAAPRRGRARTPEQRQAALQMSIDQGARRGTLTRHEVRQLRIELNRIDRQIRFARADGRLDVRERRDIERAQDMLERNIRREKRDGQVRR